MSLIGGCCLAMAVGFASGGRAAGGERSAESFEEGVGDVSGDVSEVVSGGDSGRARDAPRPGDAGYVQDRAAVLGLAGDYAVSYRYEETEALGPGYVLASPYVAEAIERVVVAQDTGDHVVLQHLLLIGEPALVVKHWREDWSYAPAAVVAYVGEGVWHRRRFVSAGRSGVWTRTVYEADGSPTYGAWGRWSHEAGVSSWSADAAMFAPLPRRELARGGDYGVLLVQDRITLTADGWSQHQDITKRSFDRDAPPLARESGVVRYQAAPAGIDFAAAEAYWTKHAPFWALARQAWAGVMGRHLAVSLVDRVGDQPRWRRFFDLADAVAAGRVGMGEARTKLDALLAEHVVTP